MRRIRFTPADCIHIILMTPQINDSLLGLKIICNDGAIPGAGENFPTIWGKFDGPDLPAIISNAIKKACLQTATVTYPKIRPVRVVVVARKIEMNRLSSRLGVGLRYADDVANRAKGEEPIIWAQARVCYSPLTERIGQGLVVLPFNRVSRVIQAHFEVLGTAKEEVAVS